MDLETAEKELAVRLYRWGQLDGERERREGYSLLTPIRDEALQKNLFYAQSLSLEEYLQSVSARQKSSQPLATAILGERFSASDQAWNDKFVAAMRQIHLEEFSRAGATKIFAVKRSLVEKLLLPSLTAAFGIKPNKVASLQWDYKEQFGDWCFSTEIDLGGTWGTEIRYHFRLKRDDAVNLGLMPKTYQISDVAVLQPQTFSLFALYGLGTFPKYAIASEEQVILAAQSLVNVHAHIIRSIPELIAGLSMQD